MAMPSDPPAPAPALTGERRLHPLSWLFVLLVQLRSFALPLVVLLVTGRGESYEFLGLVGVAGLAIVSVVQYVTYRFRLDEHGIVIRSGLFQKTVRDIPYERIHNVVLHQSILHRVFGVAEVRLESAGGDRAEGRMRVLSLEDAQALEMLVRGRGAAQRTTGAAGAPDAVEPAAEPLLVMSTAEVVRLGLISNRGMVLVAAAVGAIWQFFPNPAESPEPLSRVIYLVTGRGRELLSRWFHDVVGLAFAAVVLLILMLLIVRALSVLLALLQFHGFRLMEVGRQLRVERGLLTRVRAHLPRHRIQAWRVTEGVLHRRFHRQSLRVDSAAGRSAQDQRSVRDLAPLATPEAIRALIHHLLPERRWPPEEWRPLHPRAWRRLFVVPTMVLGVATLVLAWRYGVVGLWALAPVPLVIVRARLWAKHAGYAEGGGLVAVREGWLGKSWRFAEVTKLQALRITESPFDRRHGMATVWLDTAGADAAAGVLRVPYLPRNEAQALHDRLAGALDEGLRAP